MRKMRRILILVAVLPLLVLTSATTIVSPVQASVESRSWIGSIYSGTDAFYGVAYTIYAYEEGSTAVLVVTVKNDFKLAGVKKPINVSDVKVGFDWGINYTSPQCSRDDPVVMQIDEIRTFTVNFTVPSISVASNKFLHGYKIYVEHVNSTTGPRVVLHADTMTRSYTNPAHLTDRPDFAVYSVDQADARELSQVLSTMPVPSFNSTRARLYVYKAQNETSTGNECYRRGDFAGAETHYNNALSLYNSAYSAEETRGVELEDLQINLTRVQVKALEAQVKNTEAWASMVSSLGTTSILFGVTTVLFAIGYIIKQLGTLRKSSPKAEAT